MLWLWCTSACAAGEKKEIKWKKNCLKSELKQFAMIVWNKKFDSLNDNCLLTERNRRESKLKGQLSKLVESWKCQLDNSTRSWNNNAIADEIDSTQSLLFLMKFWLKFPKSHIKTTSNFYQQVKFGLKTFKTFMWKLCY